MTRHVLLKIAAMTVSAMAIGASPAYPQSSTAQITVLYDAFGKTSTMKKDWGFSALIEYGGKRILFDTGNNADIFAHNVEAKGVDLTKLDFAVVSHRHGDHTSGLNHLLKVNPTVKIYAPQENFGVFGAALPGTFYRRQNPQADPYVSEGDVVTPGDVVGLIEIMKSFHEIHSDADGRIARFLVENEDLVDAGQDIIALESG